MEPVTKEQFYSFVEGYPRELVKDVVRFCEPHIVQYNDFTLGVRLENN